MTVQTTVDLRFRQALPGVLADISPMERGSFRALESDIGFGVAVTRVDDDTAHIADGTGQEFLGVTIRVLDRENSFVGSNLSLYRQDDIMGVVRRGRIFVVSKVDAIEPGQPVYFYHTASGGFVPGDFSNVANAGFADLATGCTWDQSAQPGELSIIRLNT